MMQVLGPHRQAISAPSRRRARPKTATSGAITAAGIVLAGIFAAVTQMSEVTIIQDPCAAALPVPFPSSLAHCASRQSVLPG